MYINQSTTSFELRFVATIVELHVVAVVCILTRIRCWLTPTTKQFYGLDALCIPVHVRNVRSKTILTVSKAGRQYESALVEEVPPGTAPLYLESPWSVKIVGRQKTAQTTHTFTPTKPIADDRPLVLKGHRFSTSLINLHTCSGRSFFSLFVRS